MMKIDLHYETYDYEFDYTVDAYKDDFIEYLWCRHFEKPFNTLTYLVDDPKGAVYNKIEYEWWHNKIDEYSIKNEPQFIEFLKDKYYSKAYWRYEAEMEEKKKTKEQQLVEVFDFANNMHRNENYDPLTLEELDEIFLENFGGQE